jgi:hypothetical protein
MSMKRVLSRTLITAAALAVVSMPRPLIASPIEPPTATQPANGNAVDVPVKVVVLFSSGVGYFEHAGPIKGTSRAELRFKTNQINDILKSLVLEDLNGGKVTAVTYPSQDPVAKTLRSFQIDITSNPSLGELLNQLRGAKVSVTVGVQAMEGTILGLEKKQKSSGEKGNIETWVMNLINGGMIRAVELDQVTKLELEDKQLQEELGKALLALAQSRDQDKKPVTINFTGEGERQVKLGYVVETPVWKTSYRLLISSEKKDGKPQAGLQGWAIVENQTDNDWNNIQLSLVSGRPISFIQDLYQPLYVPRPTVKPELYASLRPQTYEGGMDKQKEMEAFNNKPAADSAKADNSYFRKALAGAAPPAGALGMQGVGGGAFARNQEQESLATAQSIDAAASIASVASAAKIGELFQYTVGSVSLPRQRSAMIPIITDPVEVERLSIYNQSVLPRNPLNGARIKNTTGKHLLAGPITVLDGSSYAGDASIDNVPPGQERLISYGVDLQVLVDATKNRSDSAIQTGKIVKGVLLITRKNVNTQEYTAENKSDQDKALIIEHPILQGWSLIDTSKPMETTETLYRFKGKVAAGKATKLIVKEQIVQSEELAILPTDIGQLDWYSKQGEIPKKVREVLIKAMQFKNALVDTQRSVEQHRQQLVQITAEQARIRENMKTVDQKSEYYTRLLKKLNEQETQIEKVQSEVEELLKKQTTQQHDLESYLSEMNVD